MWSSGLSFEAAFLSIVENKQLSSSRLYSFSASSFTLIEDFLYYSVDENQS